MVAMRVVVTGVPELQAALRQMNPSLNTKIMKRGMIASALEIQKDAAKYQIAAGGRGSGKALPPLRHSLTSRTGTLRRSIRVDRGPLPFAIEVGTDLIYGAVHEFGNATHRIRAFMAPALEKISKRFVDIFTREWAKEVERGKARRSP